MLLVEFCWILFSALSSAVRMEFSQEGTAKAQEADPFPRVLLSTLSAWHAGGSGSAWQKQTKSILKKFVSSHLLYLHLNMRYEETWKRHLSQEEVLSPSMFDDIPEVSLHGNYCEALAIERPKWS